MRIYYIEYTEEIGYDEFDSCVVIANNRSDAIDKAVEYCHNFQKEYLAVDILGTSIEILHEPKVVIASFNAG